MLNYAPAKHLVTTNRELEQATFPSGLTGRSNHAQLGPKKTGRILTGPLLLT
jgi:hypothetical protein